MKWTRDGWPVLVNPNGAEWVDGGLQDYDYLRHYENPLMWAKWEPGFNGGTLMTTTAVDEVYEICAHFKIGSKGRAGLYLFYNEEANIGAVKDAGPDFYVKILNDRNIATVWTSCNGKDWNVVQRNVDVSTYHHNVYKGFFALRPAYFLDGDATLESFNYKAL